MKNMAYREVHRQNRMIRFLDSIEEERLYRFRVTLNPVKALSQGAGKRGRVVPEITAEQQMQFLESQSREAWFRTYS